MRFSDARCDAVISQATSYEQDLSSYDMGYYVQADHLAGYNKPPIFFGPRGGTYIPDVYVPDLFTVVEVEPYQAVINQIPQIKAFYQDTNRCRELIVLLCTGTERGVPYIVQLLNQHGVSCNVINYHQWPNWPW